MKHYLIILTLLFLCCCKSKMEIQYHTRTVTVFDTCKTKNCLEKILKDNPKDVNAHWQLGIIYQTERNYEMAIEEFTVAIKLDPSYNLGFPYRDRANCKNNLRNDSGAVNDMTNAIMLNPTERYFYVDRGDYLNNLEKYDLALNDYNKALEIFDKHTPARFGRAKTLVILKQYKKALEDYSVLIDTSEYSTYDFFYRGVAKFKMNDKVGACEDWQTISNICDEAKDSLSKYCK